MNIVVGSGPNGLAAAIVLAQAGLNVAVHETAPVAGGATRSGELTLPGFVHDLGSAVHPMAVSSPFFSKLALQQHGLQWIWPEAAVAHPLDDGTAIMLERDVAATAAQLGSDRDAYRKLFEPLVKNWAELIDDALRPIGWPRHPFLMARFGIRALQPATWVARSLFRGMRARALFAGVCAHSTLPLESPLSASFGLIMCAAAHAVGWPIPRGGSQSIANALVGTLVSLGGSVRVSSRVEILPEDSDLTLCDVTPRQFLRLAGPRLPAGYRTKLERYKYGPGVFKVDWALREPIPWRAKDCRRAATVHLGATLEEIAVSERGGIAARPFVLLVQPSLFDSTRAPEGRHTAWAYCHVPNGSTASALAQMESQIERFAPGFSECILARAVHTPAQMQAWNENLVGGDIVGGAVTPMQFFFRPTRKRYTTPLKGVFLCSSSTPPGGAVHGMCGYWAAKSALKKRS
ncbi:MAG TPA: NAD(P)/FAD-dependent oxidoreductase [Bryobacteraceae bacterium]|nr:NAD(P)/FAD-dependent oxidoreductase [Bryobacteraceae bacterium]